MLSRRRLEAMDKRRAAVHEAGHLTVGFADGRWGSAWLYRNRPDAPAEENTWLGRCELSGRITPVVAPGGIVAECWVDEPNITAFDLARRIEDGDVLPSPTDFANLPRPEQLEAEIEKTLTSLQSHLLFFNWAVRRLIRRDDAPQDLARRRFDKCYPAALDDSVADIERCFLPKSTH